MKVFINAKNILEHDDLTLDGIKSVSEFREYYSVSFYADKDGIIKEMRVPKKDYVFRGAYEEE